jgi:hypothetical protein
VTVSAPSEAKKAFEELTSAVIRATAAEMLEPDLNASLRQGGMNRDHRSDSPRS